MEKIAKGFANHWRIRIINLLHEKPDLSVFEIADELDANFKTISEHLKKMSAAGLVLKRNVTNEVEHALSENGKVVLKFLKNLE